mmetsp:Transcript_33929/g.85747  ORF Transcript_33929/g.85747 Transcript_33929/m.85747 type:complete len:256 (-) Transcript_33929:268-1035(-)
MEIHHVLAPSVSHPWGPRFPHAVVEDVLELLAKPVGGRGCLLTQRRRKHLVVSASLAPSVWEHLHIPWAVGNIRVQRPVAVHVRTVTQHVEHKGLEIVAGQECLRRMLPHDLPRLAVGVILRHAILLDRVPLAEVPLDVGLPSIPQRRDAVAPHGGRQGEAGAAGAGELPEDRGEGVLPLGAVLLRVAEEDPPLAVLELRPGGWQGRLCSRRREQLQDALLARNGQDVELLDQLLAVKILRLHVSDDAAPKRRRH